MILAICDTSGMTKVFLILKIGLKIIFVLVPIIIIIATIINLVKIITSGKEDDLKASLPTFVKKIIAGLIIIVFPSIFSYIFTNFVPGNGGNILACLESASLERVQSLEKQEMDEAAAKKEAEDKATADKVNDRTEEEKRKNDELQKERETQQQQQGGSSGSEGNVTVSTNGLSSDNFNSKISSMSTPSIQDLEAAASKNGIGSNYLKIIIGTTQREGYVNDPYLNYGWASAMINNQVTISQMQGWDPSHSGESNYYSETNIMNGYNNASDIVLKSVYLALTERNTKIIECNGMYSTTPSQYNLIYKSSKYNCSIYELK